MSNMLKQMHFALLAALALLLMPAPAVACGGFFCSQAAPVNQSAEQIIFSRNADGTVTAVISIQYQGPSTKFAWVLPITGVPDVAVSSNLAFQRLLTATTPQYSLTQRVEGVCKVEGPVPLGAPSGQFGGTVANNAPANAPPAAPQVTVVAEGSAGPYDFVAISVAQDAGAPAQVALDWLAENNFDVSALGEDVLGSYLEQGLNLLAFRLNKSSNSGSIRPIRVTYPGDYPAIPIRPTAVAATDNMGVMVYLVADAQGIPKNYKSLVLNEALINWFGFSSSYNDVINRAADEAGGQGFVTEFGGASLAFNQTIWSQNDQQTWEGFQNMDYSVFVQQGQPVVPPATDGGAAAIPWMALFNNAATYYGSYDGFREALQAAFTLPTDVQLDALLAAPYLYQDDARIELDQLKLIAALKENVIDPMVDTQKLLLSRPYLTRLFTTLSADEMTVDPLFSTNADLADVSNRHTAEQVIECSQSVYQYQAPWRIELPQGGVVRGAGGNGWPFSATDTRMPANRKIVDLAESGAGTVVVDNSQAIWQTLNVTNVVPNPMNGAAGSGSVPIGGYDAMVPATETQFVPPQNESSGCSSSGVATRGTGLGILAMAALLVAQRRRKQSPNKRNQDA